MEKQHRRKKDTHPDKNGSVTENLSHKLLSQDTRFGAIGEKIKTLRIKKGYTSAEIFAYEHELNRISYWRMEKGANITMSSLFRILDIHQITLSEFFKDIK